MKKNLAKRMVIAALLTTWMACPYTALAQDYEGGTNANGGAKYVNKGEIFDVEENSSFTHNQSTAQNYGGGAIYNDGGTVNIGNGTSFVENYLNQPVIDTTDKDYRSAGGAIASWNGGSVNIGNNVSFINNGLNSNGQAAWASGGAIYVDTDQVNLSQLTIGEGASFTGNQAGSLGGAIYVGDSNTNITSATFNGNKAGTWGGAIFAGQYFGISGNKINIDGVTKFLNNEAGSYGGAIVSQYTNLNVGDGTNLVTFDNNKAGIDGGAIHISTDSDPSYSANSTIKNSIFTNNQATTGSGGAIFNPGSMTIENASFGQLVLDDQKNIIGAQSGNIAGQNGGAIHNQDGGSVTFNGENNIFAGNTANQGGAISNFGDGSTVNLGDNAIFAYNTANSVGGAISTVDTGSTGKTVIGDDAIFIGNKAVAGQGGAVHNQRANTEIGDNAKFYNNTAIGYGGGAIYQDTDGAATSLTVGANAEFYNNSTTSSHGGAVMNFNAGDNASLIIEEGAKFVNNSAGKTGGAISNWGAETTVGENAEFTANTSEGNGGAIYNANYGGKDSEVNISGNTIFSQNISKGDGGAIYNAGNINLDTAAGDITFKDNEANGIKNDLYLANGSETTITGDSHNVSIGGGLVSETGSALDISGSSNLTIEEGAVADISGSLTSTGTGQVVNNGDVTVSGTSTASITNNGNLTIANGGSYIANVIQDNNDSSITVNDGGIFGTSSTLQGGSLTVNDGGKINGSVEVTEAVEVNVGSATFDQNGLLVGGDSSNGYITGSFNLKDTEITLKDVLTDDLTISGNSQILTADPDAVKIGNGTSSNTLTLSNGSNNAAADKNFEVTNPATLKLSPDSGKSMTLNNNVTGTGNVLVDEKVTQVDNPEYDADEAAKDPNYDVPAKIDKHWGVGTVNVASDNSGFSGNYLQKLGTVIAQAGSKFFGGTNTVQGGTLVLQNGADLSSDINVTARDPQADANIYPEYGTVDIYNAINGTVGEDGINRITADSIANGNNAVIDYINSDDSTNKVNITAGGLGLFNGTRVEGDLTLNNDSGVRDLTFGNGSGSEADSIILNEATKLTYADNAYIKDNSTVSVGANASLNFENQTTDITYNPVISSTADTASINKSGAGSTTIASTMENYHGKVNVTGGVLNLASAEDKLLNDITINGGVMNVTGGLGVENEAGSDGKLSVTNGALAVEKFVETNDNLTVTDSNMTVGDYLAVGGDSVLKDSVVTITNDYESLGSVIIDNTVLTVGGEADLVDTTIKGDNSVATFGKDSYFEDLTVTDKSTINTLGNVEVGNTFTIGAQGSATSNPTINMQSGAINTITANDVIINSASNILFDVDPRSKETDKIIANNIITNNGSPDPYQMLIGGINFTTSPIDRNVQFDISNVLTDSQGGHGNWITLPDGGVIANSAMGQYHITASSAGSPILNAALLNLNPQQYRGQVATIASWQNQLIVNNLLFDHMNLVTRQLMDEERTANKYAAAIPFIDNYQYSIKDGTLWYKAYGAFETLSMTKGLNVGNNAYGSLIGADFPLINLKKGWKLVPTAYIAYNGGHQHFNGVSMYQNGAQLGLMGTAYKGDFMTSLLAYGGGYANDMSIRGQYGSGNDNTGNWFAGVASKTAYNIRLPHDFIIQPAFMAAYNAFGQQNWGSNFGTMSMSSGMLNGLNVAPGLNFIWQKKTFSIYATTQLVYNVMGGVDGKAGNIDLGYVRMRHCYFEYGLGVMKKFKDTFSGYLQFTIRNGGRTGIGFSGGLNWKVGKE